jgi:hypothetical protein
MDSPITKRNWRLYIVVIDSRIWDGVDYKGINTQESLVR